jgi:hypothetical protein
VAPGRSRNCTWWPAASRKTAEAGGCNIIVPGWYGFPQPAGGLPCPSPRKWHRPSMITEDFWSHNASDLP